MHIHVSGVGAIAYAYSPADPGTTGSWILWKGK